MKGRAVSLLLLLTAALASAGCATFSVDEASFFKPRKVAASSERRDRFVAWERRERVSIRMEDGVVLAGFFLPHREARGSLIYFLPNYSLTEEVGPQLSAELDRLRANLLLVDYRGYGESGGKPSLETLFSDGRAVYDHLASRSGVNPDRIIVHGFSIGSFVAASVASQRRVSGAILQGSGTNVREWSSLVVPWYFKPFVKVRISEQLLAIDNVKVVSQIQTPLLILIGKKDTSAPVKMSRELFAAAPSVKKTLVVIPKGRHVGLENQPGFREAVSRFFDDVWGSAAQ
jgi:pimeloyl-ACP methyl ester carboxylesterase